MKLIRCLITALLILSIPLTGLTYVEVIPTESVQVYHLQTYDDYLQLFAKVERGDFDDADNETHDAISALLIHCARKGTLPHQDTAELERDIEELLKPEEESFLAATLEKYSSNSFPSLECAMKHKHKHKHHKHKHKHHKHKHGKQKKGFFQKHKKAILIGFAVVIVVAVVVTCVVVAGAAAAASEVAAGAAGIAGGALSDSDKEKIQKVAEKKAEEVKEEIERDNFEEVADPTFTEEDNAKVITHVIVNKTLDEISLTGDLLPKETSDPVITCFFDSLSLPKSQDLHESRGLYAVNTGHYSQAVTDLSKAIEKNASNQELYLNRSYAYLKQGDFENSRNDFEAYTAKKPISAQSGIVEDSFDFMHGFTLGIPKGIYDSGSELGHFAKDVICHPIDTSVEMCQAMATLTELAASNEWKTVSQALAPDVVELVERWQTLSPFEKGEGTGYALGKHGGDFIIPGAATKIVAESVTGVKQVSAALRNLKNAEKILAFEMAAAAAETATQGAEFANKMAIADDVGLSPQQFSKANRTGVFEPTIEKIDRPILQEMHFLEQSGQLTEKARLALSEFGKYSPAQIEIELSAWLGDEVKMIKNKSADPVFLSKDGQRRIRFDFNNPHGDKVHLHIEEKLDGKWQDATSQHRIYPKDG